MTQAIAAAAGQAQPRRRKISEACRRALVEAANGCGALYSAPASTGLLPRARWNVCQALEEAGLTHMEAANARLGVYQWALTPAGWAEAALLGAGRPIAVGAKP